VVSGLVALVRARFPRMSARQVMAKIEATAHKPAGGWNVQVGNGVVDCLAALSEHPAPPPAPRPRPEPARSEPQPEPAPTRGIAAAGVGLCLAGLAAAASARLRRRRRDDVTAD
jgi:membrane-anchored mycosin MYCP